MLQDVLVAVAAAVFLDGAVVGLVFFAVVGGGVVSVLVLALVLVLVLVLVLQQQDVAAAAVDVFEDLAVAV